jgi:hypothetical protein
MAPGLPTRLRRHDDGRNIHGESRMSMDTCIFCPNDLTEDTAPEHILLNALGGRKTTTGVDCSACNNKFGSTIDDALAQQVVVLRNMLHLNSGTGRPPPTLKKIQAGSDIINLTNEGRPEIVAKPFIICKRDDGLIDLQIIAKSAAEAARYVPHIAEQLGCTQDEVLRLLASGNGSVTERKAGTAHHALSFGGPLAIRSAVKSALVLWATCVGNAEVRSEPYETARRFVVDGNDDFSKSPVALDSRPLPGIDAVREQFGPLFNLIYVRSGETGRVLAHFTLYNLVSWRIVLAESGGMPDLAIGLVSNPLDPATWSDTIAAKLDIPVAWLETPDYDLGRAKGRFDAACKYYYDSEPRRELGRIVDDVFAKYGVNDDPVSDPEITQKILSEISRKAAFYIVGLPHVETLSGEDVAAALRAHLEKR